MKIISRKFGIMLIIIGLAFQLLNILTYKVFGIDIDIIGLLILIVGILIMVIRWKK